MQHFIDEQIKVFQDGGDVFLKRYADLSLGLNFAVHRVGGGHAVCRAVIVKKESVTMKKGPGFLYTMRRVDLVPKDEQKQLQKLGMMLLPRNWPPKPGGSRMSFISSRGDPDPGF